MTDPCSDSGNCADADGQPAAGFQAVRKEIWGSGFQDVPCGIVILVPEFWFAKMSR